MQQSYQHISRFSVSVILPSYVLAYSKNIEAIIHTAKLHPSSYSDKAAPHCSYCTHL